MTWIVTLRGRRGTYGTGLALVACLVSHGVTLRGRRGTYGTGLALVARLVSHGAVTPRPFVWQAWHFVTSAFTLCGRRGTSWHLPSFCVAGVALDDMDCYFAWQAWHLWHWVGSGGALGQPWQLTVLICLLSICASETNSLRDSRCFLLFCQAPTSSRRCCCSIHAYIHTLHYITLHYMTWHDMTWHDITYIHTLHTCIHTYIAYIHAYIHTYIHTSMHAQLTHTGLYVDVIAKELALSEATWCYWISVFSIVCLAGLLFGCKSFTWLHTPILHHLFSLSCFPHAIFTFLLLLVGRSWHVGLSGPLIFRRKTYPISAAVGHGQPWTAAHLAPVVSASTCPQAFNHCAPINCATCWAAVAIFKPYLSSLGLAMATGPSLYFNHFSPWFFGEGSGFHMQCVLWT